MSSLLVNALHFSGQGRKGHITRAYMVHRACRRRFAAAAVHSRRLMRLAAAVIAAFRFPTARSPLQALVAGW